MKGLPFFTLCAITCSISIAGPIAQWHFDETPGTTVASAAIGGGDGILNGPVQFVGGGISGNAIQIERGGFVDMGNICAFGDQDFSLVAWVKLPAGNTDEQILLAKHQSGHGGYLIGLNYHSSTYGTASKAWFYTIGSPGFQPTSTTNINDGLWHQIVTIYRKGGIGEIFVDGISIEDQKAMPVNPATSVPFRIGSTNCCPDFGGMADEIQVYDFPLTAGQIEFLHDNPSQTVDKMISPNGIVAQFHFDQESGERFVLDSAGAFNGRLIGNADFSPNGVSGNCLIINSAGNGFANMGPAFGFSSAFTISGWFKMAGNQPAETIVFSKHQPGWVNGYFLGVNHHPSTYGTASKAWFYYGGAPGFQPTSVTSVTDGAWHQFAVVYNPSSNCDLYIDGAPVENSLGAMGVPSYAADFLIGGLNNGNTFNGYVDEVQLYNRSLSSDEIHYLFENPFSDTPINFGLLANIASHWLEYGCTSPYWCSGSDLNCSGQVDITDFMIIAENWLQ